MKKTTRDPRVLIVTPEITYLPDGMGDHLNCGNAKAGGLADVSAGLISALYHQGADVHVALPDYRTIFKGHIPSALKKKIGLIRKTVPEERIHLAQDRAFYYLSNVYSQDSHENVKLSLAFQREVINHIVPKVKPDLIHCNDWMTGLIPAMARQLEIPCLFSIHNIHSVNTVLSEIENRGIDGASFWQHLYFHWYPSRYEDVRDSNPVDLLLSGIFSAHFVNTVSPTFLNEVIEGRYDFIKDCLRQELEAKKRAGCAEGILNSPDPSFNPSRDESLFCKYGPESHVFGKAANKHQLQKLLGLKENVRAPLLFWPSRLDPVQKGCQLLSEILYDVVSRYWENDLEIIFISDGPFQGHFRDIVYFHNLSERVAICNFNERLSRLAYGASDFLLMPSSFEPCGLPQMIGPIYGTLPIAHDIGGIHDTISDLNPDHNNGNGFLFNTFDPGGLLWAIDQAMKFYMMPFTEKERQIKRIMIQSAYNFNHSVTARKYIDLYERMLKRPLITPKNVTLEAEKKDNQHKADEDLLPSKEMAKFA